MKKGLKFFSFVLSLCCVAALFTACQDKEAHNKITADYANLNNVDEATVSFECYEEFGNVHVVLFDEMSMQVLTSETVGGVDFHYPTSTQFTVYSNGQFYSLQEAFENGLLSYNNLLKVRANHANKNAYLYQND